MENILVSGAGDLIAILICIAVVVGIVVFSSVYRAKLIAGGKMVQRSNDFVEYAEIFTMKPLTPESIAAAVQAIDFRKTLGCVLTGTAKNMKFERLMNGFQAKLTCLEMSEQRTVYQFEFTAWTEQHGRAKESDVMNMLLTTIEKMFLGLDSNTQVSTKKLDFKTKRDWI